MYWRWCCDDSQKKAGTEAREEEQGVSNPGGQAGALDSMLSGGETVKRAAGGGCGGRRGAHPEDTARGTSRCSLQNDIPHGSADYSPTCSDHLYLVRGGLLVGCCTLLCCALPKMTPVGLCRPGTAVLIAPPFPPHLATQRLFHVCLSQIFLCVF